MGGWVRRGERARAQGLALARRVHRRAWHCAPPPTPLPPIQARVDEADLAALLKKVPIKLGGGKATVALADLVPAAGLRDLERACEDYARSI